MGRILHPFFGIAIFVALMFMFVRFVHHNIPEQESRPKRENQSLLNGPQVDTSKAGVVASQDQVDSARALFYPSFDIKAFFGLDSIHLHTLFIRLAGTEFNE